MISKKHSKYISKDKIMLAYSENIQRISTLDSETIKLLQSEINIDLARKKGLTIFFLESERTFGAIYRDPTSVIIHQDTIYIITMVNNKLSLDFKAPITEVTFTKTLTLDLNIIHDSHFLVFGRKKKDSSPVTTVKVCDENRLLGIDHNFLINYLENLKSKYMSEDFLLESLEKGYYPSDLVDISNLGNDYKVYSEFIAKKISERDISVYYPNIFNPEIIQKSSLLELEKILKEYEFKEFSLVELTRSSNNDIKLGNYIYEIDKRGNIKLILNPLLTVFDRNGNSIQVFDKNRYVESKSSFLEIKNEDIYDFQLFGSEMMVNNVQSADNSQLAGTIDSPNLFGTAIREIFLGTAYSSLKGMSGMLSQINQTIKSNKIETISTIEDSRLVQLILNDRTDIEFKGISIYYDFNRKMGNIKNKKSEIGHIERNNQEVDITSKIREYKELLDSGLIDDQEFKSLKKKLLGLK